MLKFATISRSFAGRTGVFLALFAALLLLAKPALADTLVKGTNNPDRDVKNVQDAVAKGGTIRLAGLFDFGPAGRVTIDKDVRILGEGSTSSGPRTVIKGGYWTLYAPLPEALGGPGPIVAVHDIRFAGAKGTPLHFAYTGGVDVRNVEVVDVKPMAWEVGRAEGGPLPFAAGVVVGPRLARLGSRTEGAARGTIRVEHCRLDLRVDNPAEVYGLGVMVDWTTGADTAIRDNEIFDASRSGIEALDNALAGDGKGSLVIADNRIDTPDDGIAFPNDYGPNGIVAGWWLSTPGGADITRNVPPSVSSNRIRVHGDRSIGMLFFANNTVAVCNDINLGGGPKARGLVQTGSHGFFANNRVRGNGQYAIYCHAFEALAGSSNVFAWTGLNEFTPIKSQFFLGGNANVVVDPKPLVEDKGQYNRVVETLPCSLGEADPEE